MRPADGAGRGWHTFVPDDHPAAALLEAAAVRERCALVAAACDVGDSALFGWNPERFDEVAAYVAETIRLRHPDLQVPYHSRWRHFETGGVDRWAALADAHGLSGDERARARIDLVIPSVLLDAGAGAAWRWREPDSGAVLSRSEGLGVASLALFASGALSSDPRAPLRADAAALARVTPEAIGRAFQAGPDNPLVGLAGRAALLSRLGEVAAATPAVFGEPARLGNLLDALRARAVDGRLQAAEIVRLLLRALGPVWPGRTQLDGIALGDTWPHAAVATAAAPGLVPFHKLTQWLTYSLLEPLEEAGLAVEGLDALTGLPEYRNGGLLLDFGAIEPRSPAFFTDTLRVDDAAVIEWRALTVVGLDRVAELVRARLGLDAAAFPLARVLEGGTWAAGRRIAAQRRPDGSPPVRIDSDGTVF